MIPDFLHKNQVQYYIFQKTGVTLTRKQIARLIKSGEIKSFKTPQNRWATTERAVNEFIREHTKKVDAVDNKLQKYGTLLECHQRIRDSKKSSADSLES